MEDAQDPFVNISTKIIFLHVIIMEIKMSAKTLIDWLFSDEIDFGKVKKKGFSLVMNVKATIRFHCRDNSEITDHISGNLEGE